jgi:hypothetical protein
LDRAISPLTHVSAMSSPKLAPRITLGSQASAKGKARLLTACNESFDMVDSVDRNLLLLDCQIPCLMAKGYTISYLIKNLLACQGILKCPGQILKM